MTYYFLLSTFVFINWASDIDEEIPLITKKLLTELKKFSEVHPEIIVEVVKETEDNINSVCNDMGKPEMCDIVKQHYQKVADVSEGEEFVALVNVARKQSNFHDEVIIVNGSNSDLQEECKNKDGIVKENISVKNEKEAYIYLITKVKP